VARSVHRCHSGAGQDAAMTTSAQGWILEAYELCRRLDCRKGREQIICQLVKARGRLCHRKGVTWPATDSQIRAMTTVDASRLMQ